MKNRLSRDRVGPRGFLAAIAAALLLGCIGAAAEAYSDQGQGLVASPHAQAPARSSTPDRFLGRTTWLDAFPPSLLHPPVSPGSGPPITPLDPKVALAAQPLHVEGNRVVYGNGRAFIPYGTSLVGGPEQWQWARFESAVTAQIEASASWGANTVRVQAAPANLFDEPTPGLGYNVQFQSELQREADLARSLGMRFALNDQAQFTTLERNPTELDVRFWRVEARQFAHQPNVIFDLFNEPSLSRRGTRELKASPNWVWSMWQRGGNNAGTRYAGMQTLVATIRQAADNIIWVEGPHDATTLTEVPRYPIQGRNLVYSIHHPELVPSEWGQLFANLARTYPVVDGEWSQYAGHARLECNARAYELVPALLGFLRRHRIGLIAWGLQSGVLLQDRNHTEPTNILTPGHLTTAAGLLSLKPSEIKRDYRCDAAHLGEGSGRLVFEAFKQYKLLH